MNASNDILALRAGSFIRSAAEVRLSSLLESFRHSLIDLYTTTFVGAQHLSYRPLTPT
ncbi:hypothetical protein M378DRAFT_164938 [Amanita muscaria Koide BX008]|uniref:Uncharacterized protein n=1 Tax=Amanita muscaria (strain Koide BX008) TaxID=946122 RepID=A0A0C2WN89_AMAMK|nr:hypothetical protein M378DRAFT_164938 [Amanita muscaria Koide BX008]